MSVVLHELKGKKNLHYTNSEWGPILNLIRLSEALPANDADWEFLRDGYVVSAPEARAIARFMQTYLEENAEGDLFEIEEPAAFAEGERAQAEGAKATQAALAVSRKRLEGFVRFSRSGEGGFSIW